MNTRALPRAGLAYGAFPQRQAEPAGASPWRAVAALAEWLRPPARSELPPLLRHAYEEARAQLQAGSVAQPTVLAEARDALARAGLGAREAGTALALVADAVQREHGLEPYPTQLQAAWLMLQGRFAEMATGEGKTLAMGLAAGAAAMAGVPVHVLTANDYLAARDEAWLAPVYRALGLTSASVVAATSPAERPARYRQAIVHTTAKEIGFDYLRDHKTLAGVRDPRRRRARALAGERVAEPVLPGLCWALLDEADSLLLDEATVPLLLATSAGAAAVAPLRRAWALSGGMVQGRHYELRPEFQRAVLTAEGQARALGAAAKADAPRAPPPGPDSGAQAPPPTLLGRAFADAVEAALVARHLLQRDRHYVLGASGSVDLIDEPTGRVAAGRRWSGLLYPMVQVKEGQTPSAPTATSAQITYPRLFARYLRLSGMSGTLLEARVGLRMLYGVGVARVPLVRPDQRRTLATRLFADSERRWQAVVASVQRHAAAGRPVLVGVESVAAAHALSRRLAAEGVEHQRLDAAQDADEAALIAAAGQGARITVATNMAGRGTDIRLDERACAAGGLHVIATMRSRSRRIDRQLAGRAARQGDPGSVETLLALDDAMLAQACPAALRHAMARLALAAGGEVPGLAAAPLLALAQRSCEWADSLRRAYLAKAEHRGAEMLGFAGPSE